MRAEILGPGTSHHEKAGFGEAVKQAARLRAQAGNGSDIDDGAAGFSLDHPGHDQADQAQGGLDVDLHHLVEHFIRHFEGRALPDVRGAVVDKNINRPDALHRLRDELLQGFFVTDVAGERDGLARQRSEFAGGGFEVFELAAGDDDVGAGGCKTLRDGLADAAAAASHQSDFVFQDEAAGLDQGGATTSYAGWSVGLGGEAPTPACIDSCRSCRRRYFPTPDLGRESRNSISRGTL